MDVPSLTLLVAKLTALLLLAFIVAAALRRAPAGARHQVWLAALAATLILPALLALAPLQLPLLPAEGPWMRVPVSEAASMTQGPPLREPRLDGAAARVQAAPAATVSDAAGRQIPAAPSSRLAWPPLTQLLAGVWAAGAAVLLAWLGAGRLTVRRIVRSARPLDAARVQPIACELADRLGLDRLPAVLASDRIEMPFATGLWRSTIVLPASAAGWPEDRLRHVLLHELAHVRRRDLVGHTLGRLACAAYWFHPLVWTAARRLRDESERACDDLVLACGARATDYADHLLDIVAAARRVSTPAVALPMARRREFEGRVLAILDPARARRSPSRLHSAVVLGGLGATFLVVAASAPAARATALQEPEPPAAEAALAPEAEEVPAPAPKAAPAANPVTVPVPAGAMFPPLPAAQTAQPPQPPQPVQAPGRVAGGRRDASERAGALDPQNRALLIRVLRTDGDAEVRRSAAWALAEATEPDAVEALVAALRGDADGEVREMAAWALADVPRDEVAAAMGEALRKDQDAEVRSTAAWALGQRREGDTAALLAALSDADTEVREAVVWALGQRRLEKAPAEIVSALGDSEASVRLVAAWALGEIQDASAAPAVKAAFAKETDDEVRRALFRAVLFLGDRSRETLEQALTSKDPELRSRAVQMLAGGRAGHWPWPWPWPQPRPMP